MWGYCTYFLINHQNQLLSIRKCFPTGSDWIQPSVHTFHQLFLLSALLLNEFNSDQQVTQTPQLSKPQLKSPRCHSHRTSSPHTRIR